MTNDSVRSPDGSGSRPTGRASKAVSSVPASIPNAGTNTDELFHLLRLEIATLCERAYGTKRGWERYTIIGEIVDLLVRRSQRPKRSELDRVISALRSSEYRLSASTLNEAAGFLEASAIEARRAETAQTGSVGDESAGPQDDAPTEVIPVGSLCHEAAASLRASAYNPNERLREALERVAELEEEKLKFERAEYMLILNAGRLVHEKVALQDAIWPLAERLDAWETGLSVRFPKWDVPDSKRLEVRCGDLRKARSALSPLPQGEA